VNFNKGLHVDFICTRKKNREGDISVYKQRYPGISGGSGKTMIIYIGERVTANELAKLVVYDKGSVGTEYWEENSSLEFDKLTEREKYEINMAMNKQLFRVGNLLGVSQLWAKIKKRNRK
jgi:hypothetical protein